MANERYMDDGTPLADCDLCDAPCFAKNMVPVGKKRICEACGFTSMSVLAARLHDLFRDLATTPQTIQAPPLREQLIAQSERITGQPSLV